MARRVALPATSDGMTYCDSVPTRDLLKVRHLQRTAFYIAISAVSTRLSAVPPMHLPEAVRPPMLVGYRTDCRRSSGNSTAAGRFDISRCLSVAASRYGADRPFETESPS